MEKPQRGALTMVSIAWPTKPRHPCGACCNADDNPGLGLTAYALGYTRDPAGAQRINKAAQEMSHRSQIRRGGSHARRAEGPPSPANLTRPACQNVHLPAIVRQGKGVAIAPSAGTMHRP